MKTSVHLNKHRISRFPQPRARNRLEAARREAPAAGRGVPRSRRQKSPRHLRGQSGWRQGALHHAGGDVTAGRVLQIIQFESRGGDHVTWRASRIGGDRLVERGRRLKFGEEEEEDASKRTAKAECVPRCSGCSLHATAIISYQ